MEGGDGGGGIGRPILHAESGQGIGQLVSFDSVDLRGDVLVGALAFPLGCGGVVFEDDGRCGAGGEADLTQGELGEAQDAEAFPLDGFLRNAGQDGGINPED